MRILYANHTSLVSGGERSLLDLLTGLPPDVDPIVACPPGRLTEMVRALGKPVAALPEMDGSFRLHPRHSLRGLVKILRGGIELRLLAARRSAQIVHANSTRAGLMAAVAGRLGGPPAVVSVRDCLPDSGAGNIVRSIIGGTAAAVIANSKYTAGNFSRNTARTTVTSIHNPVDLTRFDPVRFSRLEARARLGLDPSIPLLGVVGQIAPWKAQDDAIRCAALLRGNWPNLHLLLVGDVQFKSNATRYDNQAFAASLRRLAQELSLDGAVQFLGERDDVPLILRALDLLLVPSWEEPFGRTVIEAMAMETPVVATRCGGPAEVITDAVDGRLLEPQQPQLWATAIHELLAHPERRAALGRQGRRRVRESFGLDVHVGQVVNIYRHVLGMPTN